MELLEKDLTEKIIAACLEVSNELGAGFLDGVYERALLIALRDEEKPGRHKQFFSFASLSYPSKYVTFSILKKHPNSSESEHVARHLCRCPAN